MRKPLRLSTLAAALAVSALFVMSSAGSAAPNFANAPTGTHFAGGTSEPSCAVINNRVTCGPEYQLAGVGNIDATANLDVNYTATVVCINGGGNPSDGQHQGSFTSSTTLDNLRAKNGRLTVPVVTSPPAPTEEQFLAQQTCPNPNWEPTVPGGITLSSFTYTLTFDGFPGAFITITGP